jgi:hypothetical protein
MYIYIAARCSAEATGLTAAHNNSLLWGTYRYVSPYYLLTAAHKNSLTYIPGQLYIPVAATGIYVCRYEAAHTASLLCATYRSPHTYIPYICTGAVTSIYVCRCEAAHSASLLCVTCPLDSTTYVSSYYYICVTVRILVDMCGHTSILVYVCLDAAWMCEGAVVQR